MEKTVLIISIFLLAIAYGQSTDNCGGFKEEFGYVDVRPGAHMFWVTYHAELPGDRSNHPLIMWLQGGPGSSSVGYGNFWMLGPCDIHEKVREHRWTHKANLMFVDNPVGTGYSYVDDESALTTTNLEIAQDLVALMKDVYRQHPEYEKMPFFVYSESYGGKMAIDFSLELLHAIENKTINCNFHGAVLGDSWTSPIDYVNTWGSYLYEMGFVNEAELVDIETAAAKCQKSVDKGNWYKAYIDWANTQSAVFRATEGVDFYNIHAENSSFYSPQAAISTFGMEDDVIRRTLGSYAGDPLSNYMNGEQKQKWNIPTNVDWGGQSGAVFQALTTDFMKPVVLSVAQAVNLNRIHVAVYNGNLDLICDTPGTYLWVNNMDFADKEDYHNTARVNMKVEEFPNIAWYYQRKEYFSVNTFLRAGHMMPLDTPTAALQLIDLITEWGAEAANSYQQRKKAEENLSNFLVHSEAQRLTFNEKSVNDVVNNMEENKAKNEPSEKVVNESSKNEQLSELITDLPVKIVSRIEEMRKDSPLTQLIESVTSISMANDTNFEVMDKDTPLTQLIESVTSISMANDTNFEVMDKDSPLTQLIESVTSISMANDTNSEVMDKESHKTEQLIVSVKQHLDETVGKESFTHKPETKVEKSNPQNILKSYLHRRHPHKYIKGRKVPSRN